MERFECFCFVLFCFVLFGLAWFDLVWFGLVCFSLVLLCLFGLSVVVTTFSFKEKLFLAVADALNEKIYASSKKQALLRAAGCDMRRFVQRKEDARLRVVSLSKCSFDALCHFSLEQPQHDLVAGFSPSGWNWAKVSKRKYREQGILHTTRAYDRVVCIGLPYSEHSSYAELIECVAHFRPRVVIPTVLNTGKSKEVELL